MTSRRRITWYERQKRRKTSPFFRLLDRSFQFRLLLAGAIALVLLGAVNRFEHCAETNFAAGCQLEGASSLISIGNVESFSIVTAALLYLLEGGRRRRLEHQAAMDTIIAADQAGAVVSLGRIHSLEILATDGLWLDGLNLSRINLEQLEAPSGRFRTVDFSHSDLTGANLKQADLAQASFVGANLTHANLSGAILTKVNFQGANLRGANLSQADLSNADLAGAILDQTNLLGATLTGIKLDPGTVLNSQ